MLDKRVTLPSFMAAPNGINCIQEAPDYKTLIFCHVADADLVSTYPSVSQQLNISRETCVSEFCRMEGISEHRRREVGVNLTAGRTNAVEICEKILGAPTLDRLLADFLGEVGPIDESYRTRTPEEIGAVALTDYEDEEMEVEEDG